MSRIERQNITVPVIIQAVGGDLRIKGRSGADLVVDGDGVRVEQIDDEQPYLVRSDGDCRVTVPGSINVIVQQVGGDAKLTDLGGITKIGAVGGDLTLRNLQGLQIDAVGGDLRIKWADGPVTIRAVGADATIREVRGNVSIDKVGADLYLRNIEGSCVVEQIGSDLVLSMDFAPGGEYRFRAGNDVLCRIQPEADVRFVLPAEVAVELDVPADISESEDGTEQHIVIGEGSATVYIEAGDELRLVSEEEDYVFDLGAQIEEELEARLSTLEEKLSQQLEGLDERIQASAERYSGQIENYAERAQQQAQRAVERVRRSIERQEKKGKRKRESGSMPRFEFGFGWGTPPTPPAPPDLRRRRPATEPVSEQERLMILKMVQENKITIEEAERLLAALEGQD
ncbi:MAG: hypothetical protein GXY36_16120 [Chloroflexi bacterium]|jgi:hypothetical protein|nr:hypothetical protein [Chloroflexota bacterium]